MKNAKNCVLKILIILPEIIVADCGTCDDDIWNKINMLVKLLVAIEFTIMKLLAILQSK